MYKDGLSMQIPYTHIYIYIYIISLYKWITGASQGRGCEPLHGWASTLVPGPFACVIFVGFLEGVVMVIWRSYGTFWATFGVIWDSFWYLFVNKVDS